MIQPGVISRNSKSAGGTPGKIDKNNGRDLDG